MLSIIWFRVPLTCFAPVSIVLPWWIVYYCCNVSVCLIKMSNQIICHAQVLPFLTDKCHPIAVVDVDIEYWLGCVVGFPCYWVLFGKVKERFGCTYWDHVPRPRPRKGQNLLLPLLFHKIHFRGIRSCWA